jgi:hypothetical protein
LIPVIFLQREGASTTLSVARPYSVEWWDDRGIKKDLEGSGCDLTHYSSILLEGISIIIQSNFLKHYKINIYINNHQDSSISIATGYKLDGLGLIPDRGKRFFSSPQCPDWLWGPPSPLSNTYWGLFPLGLKWLRNEADH